MWDPGADPKSRDWSELPEDEAVDQAADLPETTGIMLDRTAEFLGNPRHFDAWLNSACRILKARGLERIIDLNIPRPKRDDPKAPRWLKYSRQVQQWLAANMSDKILRNIRAQGQRVELADEFVDQAKRVLRHYGPYADIETVSNFLSMNRSDHASTRQFVAAFEIQYTRLMESHVDISPYLAMCILLTKLNTEENKEIMVSAVRGIKELPENGDLWREFSLADFRGTCLDIRLKLEHKALAKTHKTQYEPAPQQKMRPLGRVRKAPPPHIDPYEYAQAWRDSRRQKPRTGECAYCEVLHHNESTCWYINDVRRPQNWKPTLDLWVYESISQSGKERMEGVYKKGSGDPKPKDGWDTSCLPGPSTSNTTASITEEPPKPLTPHRTLEPPSSLTPNSFILDTPYSFSLSPGRWIVDSSICQHICADRSSFIDYQEYDHIDTPFEWLNPAGKRARAHGTGKVIIGLLLENGRVNDFIIECVYHPDCRIGRFSPSMAEKDLNIGYNDKTMTLHDLVHDNKVVGHAVRENGVAVLRTASCLVKREPVERVIAKSECINENGIGKQIGPQKGITLLGSEATASFDAKASV